MRISDWSSDVCSSDLVRQLAEINAEHALEQVLHQTFDQRDDLVLRHERGFDVELREFRLAVGAQILVAEAAGDQVVAVERAEERRVGTEGVSTCRCRWSPCR